jgi:hypothetical protein
MCLVGRLEVNRIGKDGEMARAQHGHCGRLRTCADWERQVCTKLLQLPFMHVAAARIAGREEGWRLAQA